MRALSIAPLLLIGAVAAPGQILVNGAGATFPYPIYAKWFDEFRRLRPDALINYQPVGSGAGIRQLMAGVVDFGASDRPLTDDELAALPSATLHFPTVVGAVVPIYNVPGVRGELNFTPEVLAAIFLGKVTRWSDPLVAASNPGIRLPDAPILPVHRTDGSGTTYVLTDFLSKTSAEWSAAVGRGTSVAWPTGVGAKGNDGVAAVVKGTRYSFGYVELIYAVRSRVSYGRVRNAAGHFVHAQAATIEAAAAARADSVPDDFRVSITNAPGPAAYPLASYTWLLTPARISDPTKKKIITDFLRWMLTHGQAMAEPLGYAPLPRTVLARALRAVDRIE
jgi:phosphate transport system substrate-binding protein